MEGLSKDEIISSFCGITGVSSTEASDYLNAADWDADAALAEFYQSQEDAAAGDALEAATAGAASSSATPAPAPAVDPSYTGPRTLDGRPAPQSQSSSSFGRRPPAQQKKKGVMTMSALRGGSGGGGSGGGHGHGHGHGHDHDHDDDDDDSGDDDFEGDDGGRGDLFAGGEKSGLAVQDPNAGGPASDAQKVIRDIISKAKANRNDPNAQPAAAGSSQPSSSRFRGSGQTLGGEGVESRRIPDLAAPAGGAAASSPAAAASGRGGGADEAQERVLHIWQDGFSIDDGPLHRYDDPNNAADLQMIRQGRAPLHLMNVQFGQTVDVKLDEHEEKWYQLPRVYRPFSGQGRRLGSPVPGSAPVAVSMAVPAAAAAAAVAAGPAASASAAAPAIDEAQPTLTIRVQLPDGTRLPARFNTTHTIGDVYAFVQRALPAAQQTRPWVLATTFPSKDHTDHSLVLGETAEFKRGGAAVVKWT